MTLADRPSPVDRLWLADWRRRVAELYAEVRIVAESDPAAAWDDWREEREALYRFHPQSPLPSTEREGYRARHWPYDEAMRFVVAVEAVEAVEVSDATPAGVFAIGAPLALPNSGAESPAFDRLGIVRLPLPGGGVTLPVFWMRGYVGGLFLPLLDGTSGTETYGAGRYLLDTGKGADLGGDPGEGTLVVDCNFAFQPSCAFDPRWACPLAPPDSRIAARLEAGERLR